MAAVINYDDPVSNALASSTLTPRNKRNIDKLVGNQGTTSGAIQLDSSYPTGGYPVLKFGLSAIGTVFFMHPPGYVISYNIATDKIMVFDSGAAGATFAEVPNATNLSALQLVGFEAKGLV